MSAVDAHGHGLLLDALIWRAHPDYIAALGYPPSDISTLNELAVARTKAAIDTWRASESRSHDEFPVLIAADIGPRGDGYRVDESPTVEAAFDYHQAQIKALARTEVDVLCAWTMTNANEAIGIAKVAAELDVPVIISPTVETDGRLPDGSSLGDFIHSVDDATNGLPAFYMVNCAHPTHLAPALDKAKAEGQSWLARFSGFRANSSTKSHEELDNSTALDRGNPSELAEEVAMMQRNHNLRIVGGCCGTDVEHIAAIAEATSQLRT
jgi:homocysteine S-methyltransferase